MVSISIRVSLPEGKFATKGWLAEIARTQRQTSVPRLRKLFQQTVFGWSNKPTFGWAQQRSKDEISITMYPQGSGANIWALVNAGSPSHDIPAKSGGWLRFRPGYRSATTPGSLQSRRAYRSGPYWKARIIKPHPGFKARKFTELIADEYRNPFMDDMQTAINTTARS